MSFFFFNDTATTEIYTLSLHDALPICQTRRRGRPQRGAEQLDRAGAGRRHHRREHGAEGLHLQLQRRISGRRSEEHTSELQSRQYLVCRLLLEKKKKITKICNTHNILY